MLIHFRPYAISSQEISNTLTKREKQILDRIVQGQSNLEIADALFVAESTVKTHVYKLYKNSTLAVVRKPFKNSAALLGKKLKNISHR